MRVNDMNHASTAYYLYGGAQDEYKGRVRKTKFTHPYTYDPFIMWQKYPSHPDRTDESPMSWIMGDKVIKPDSCIYSDRISMWDQSRPSFEPRWDALVQKHKLDGLGFCLEAHPLILEQVLRDWSKQPKLELLEIQEHCNVSNGYPVWLYCYRNNA